MINHKHVYRLFKEEGLNLHAKAKRKHVSESRALEKNPSTKINEVWAMDFVSDQLFNGKRIRALTIIDTYTRQCLAIHVDTPIKGKAVADLLGKNKRKDIREE